jgi:hypothetical protein
MERAAMASKGAAVNSQNTSGEIVIPEGTSGEAIVLWGVSGEVIGGVDASSLLAKWFCALSKYRQ